ncbi:MAG: ribonuclease III [Clostridia bacterium]|nr:ribonuclease III [Clostridia bacterium]
MEKGLKLCNMIKDTFSIESIDIKSVSPLTLAYIGDSIYDLIIRTIVVCKGNKQVNKLHKEVSELVKAHGQVLMYEAIEELLTEEEMSVFKRGRNAKSYTSAKNATKIDYRKATGYEALLGYLYMQDNMDRILELVKIGLDKVYS